MFHRKPAMVERNEWNNLYRNARDILTMRFRCNQMNKRMRKMRWSWVNAKMKTKMMNKVCTERHNKRENIDFYDRVHSEWASERVSTCVMGTRMCVEYFVVVRQQPLIETGPVSTLTDFFSFLLTAAAATFVCVFAFWLYTHSVLRQPLEFAVEARRMHANCTTMKISFWFWLRVEYRESHLFRLSNDRWI